MSARDTAQAYFTLGLARLRERDGAGAVAALRKSLSLVPDSPNGLMFLAAAHQLCGDLDAAIAAHRRAARANPEDHTITSNLIILRDFDPSATMADLAAQRRSFQDRHCRRITPFDRHRNDRSPDRPLRIGYVSSYFKETSGGAIFCSIVENHDKASFTPICYSTTGTHDALTARIAACAEWVNAKMLHHKDLARRIEADRIDILVDIDGHSPINRLMMFAYKPAPVQVTGWGHAGGTGLAAMDYAFVDPVFARPGEQQFFSERLVNLPCVLTLEPPAEAPPVVPAPVERNGYVTFGCLNRLTKVSSEVLAVWARILRRAPDSRLLLKGRQLDDPARPR